MNSSSDYKQIARDALSGRWPLAILVSFLAMLLGGYNASSSGSHWNISHNTGDSSFSSLIHTFPWLSGFFIFFSSIFIFLAIFALVLFFIGGAIELGHNLFYINLVNGHDENVLVSTLFSRFSILLKAFGLRLVMSIFIFLWSLLFVIPGIIAGYSYSMAPYLMAENQDMGIMEAIRESKQLMSGHKLELFLLQLSFIGWLILGALTFGIGMLFVVPYLSASKAAFYLDLIRLSNPAGSANDSFYYDSHVVEERNTF